MIKKKNNLESFYKSFEKLTKVALIKIEKEQATDVSFILDEFYRIFSSFLNKRRNFKESFSKTFGEDALSEDTEVEFLNIYIDSFIKIWKTSYSNQSSIITEKANFTYDKSLKLFSKCRECSITHLYYCNQLFLKYFHYVVSETSNSFDLDKTSTFVYEYIKWMTTLEDRDLTEYLTLLINPINFQGLKSSFIIANFSNNESGITGIEILYDFYFKAWKKAFEKDLDKVAYNISTIIEEIISTFLLQGNSSKNYSNIISYFINLLQSISTEVNKNTGRSAFSNKTSYIWFFNIVFKKNFDLSLIDILQVQLFSSLKVTIKNKNKKQFTSFIEFIIHGMFEPNYAALPDISFKNRHLERDSTDQFENAKSKLVLISHEAFTLKDLPNVKAAYNRFCIAVDSFKGVNLEIRTDIKIEYKNFFEKEFKYNILQQTVIWLGTYCLYLKEYEFIEELLFYNQPKDATGYWLNQDINPLNIRTIFSYYQRRYEVDAKVTFLWDGHHDFQTYYRLYLAILLVNAINQNDRKGESWRNEYNIDTNGKSLQILENTINSFEDLINSVILLKENTEIVNKCGLSSASIDKSIILINNIISTIQSEKKFLKQTSEIDLEKAQNFIDSIYQRYLNGGSIRNIINFYNKIADDNFSSSDQSKEIQAIVLNEITPKNFLAVNDNGMYFGFPTAYASKIIFDENILLKGVFINISSKHSERMIPSSITPELDKIENIENKVFIFSNLYPAYEVFGSDPNFLSADQISKDNQPIINEFVGKYKGADVFSYYDDTKWKNLLILTKHPDLGLGMIKYYTPTELDNFNIKQHFFWKVIDLNNDDEIVKSIIEKQPHWLLQNYKEVEEQLEFLRQQVNIKICYKIGFELPQNFEAHFYRFE